MVHHHIHSRRYLFYRFAKLRHRSTLCSQEIIEPELIPLTLMLYTFLEGENPSPIPGIMAKSRNKLETQNLLLIFPNLHFDDLLSPLRVSSQDMKSQEEYFRLGSGGNDVARVGVGMTNIEQLIG